MTNNHDLVTIVIFCVEGDEYTKIGIAIIIQILEGLHALCYR